MLNNSALNEAFKLSAAKYKIENAEDKTSCIECMIAFLESEGYVVEQNQVPGSIKSKKLMMRGDFNGESIRLLASSQHLPISAYNDALFNERIAYNKILESIGGIIGQEIIKQRLYTLEKEVDHAKQEHCIALTVPIVESRCLAYRTMI